MSLKQRAHGSELYGYPIPRRPITFDLRQEPDAGKPHVRICAGGEEQFSSLPRPFAEREGVATDGHAGVKLHLQARAMIHRQHIVWA